MRTPTLYLSRPSGLHALHPLTKLTIVGIFLVAAAALPYASLVFAVYLFGLLPVAAWGKVFKPFLRSSLLLIWPFALSLYIIQSLFTPGETILFSLGSIHVKLEGIILATEFAARILVWLGAATLLMLVTRPDKLMLALVERGLPRQIAYIILTSLQIIPRFQGRAQTILDAQRSRALETEGPILQRLRMLIPLVAPLILSSILELDERAIALEARAFSRSGGRTSYFQLVDSRRQTLARRILALAMLSLIGIRILGIPAA